MVLAEAMVRPASRMVGQTLELTNFPARSHCTVLGIQRRARMLRTRLGELRLEPGDVLLLLGLADDIEQLRGDPDVLVMEWSASAMPLVRKAPMAVAIFAAIVAPAAVDLVPIVVTALVGVLALILTGCLNVRQAARAVDRQIVLIIASSLALGSALEATGGAAYLAGLVLLAMQGAPPGAILSVLFLLIAIAHQRAQQQCRRGPVHAGRGQSRPSARRRGVPLRARGGVRRELLVRDPDRLPDQPSGDGAGALPVRRFRGRRPAAGDSAVAGVLGVRALVLWGVMAMTGVRSGERPALPTMKLFFSTELAACPYLPDRRERRLVTMLDGADPDRLHDRLMQAGFRRSQGLAYRPACPGCEACVPVRIPVASFRLTRPWRRIWLRNHDLAAAERPPAATREQFGLFQRYLASRHGESGMAAHELARLLRDDRGQPGRQPAGRMAPRRTAR